MLLVAFLGWLPCQLWGQSMNNRQTAAVPLSGDTVSVDSLSLVPGSIELSMNGKPIADSLLFVDAINGRVAWLGKPSADSLTVSFRTFPINFGKPVQHKNIAALQPTDKGLIDPLVYNVPRGKVDLFEQTGLNKQGSISRGLSFGNNQDLAVNSDLNLQLSGKITDRVNVLAVITDDNIPIQADGNTQQLQEFDRAYMQLYDENNKLTVGDFQLRETDSYFLRYQKKARGGSLNTRVRVQPGDGQGAFTQVQASAAISRGKWSRNVVQGVEGNQGPYRLTGAEGERFIIVLSGTERVYIDGVLLTRGQEHDYVINYNTAELTFTARQLITKDKRIIIEFQYSDQNYARSLFQVSNKWETERLTLHAQFYSEQDARNQPLQQELDDDRRELLSNIGDSLQLALAPGIDSIGFDEGAILYRLTDTTVADIAYDSVFVFSTNPDSAFYRLTFSNVGPGNGNYELARSLSNGKVYRWVAPIAGVPQGSFEPVVALVSPKQRQMLTIAANYKLGKRLNARVELAGTKNDLNTFSSADAQDDYGFAGLAEIAHKKPLAAKEGKQPWVMTTKLSYEHVNEHFVPVERFRTVEFQRDWNLQDVVLTESQHIATGSLGFNKKGVGNVEYSARTFNTASEYNGLQNRVAGNLRHKGWHAEFQGSLVEADQQIRTSQFLRHNARITKALGPLTVGIRELQDRNELRAGVGDTLMAAAFNFYEVEGFVNNGDTAEQRYQISYLYREDKAAKNNRFELGTVAQSVGFQMDLLKNPKRVVRAKIAYRTLDIRDSSLTTTKPDNTLLSRLEYNLQLLKGAIRTTSFYEIGSGLEVKKEFSFLEVPAGQGVYAWTDYNDNGQQELDEFEVAQFSDQARYIRVFTPTNEFVKAFTNQFNQSLFLEPRAVWRGKKGVRGFLARFSNQSAFRIDRKTNYEDLLSAYNPFVTSIADTSLISLNSSLRNSLFFNKTSPTFGLEYNYQDRRGKELLTNGFQSRGSLAQSVRLRWNVTRQILLNVAATQGEKTLLSDFFSTRNYRVSYVETEPKVTWQPGTTFRIAALFKYSEKLNAADFGGEAAIYREIGFEGKYNAVGKGSFQAEVGYVNISWNSTETSSPVAYEMLEALQPGENLKWEASYQQTLMQSLQLSVLYSGRAAQKIRTVHTGGVQLRWFF